MNTSVVEPYAAACPDRPRTAIGPVSVRQDGADPLREPKRDELRDAPAPLDTHDSQQPRRTPHTRFFTEAFPIVVSCHKQAQGVYLENIFFLA